jgi:hypothetical protein
VNRRSGIVAVVLALVTASCGLGDKQHRADAIVESVDKLFAARTASGVMAVRTAALQVPDVGRGAETGAAQGPPLGTYSPPILTALGLDLAHRRALVRRDPKNAEVFDDLDFYGTRVGVSERDARPWLRLRLDDLEEGTGELRVPDDSPLALGAALNPVVLVEMAAGALAGSIERGVPEKLAGVSVTRYRARFDVEKTLLRTRKSSYPEDDREAIETLFSLLTIKGTVNRGTAWIDNAGRLRRFQLELRVSRQRDLVFGVKFDIALSTVGDPVAVDVPDDASILEADSVVAFVRSVVPELRPREAS